MIIAKKPIISGKKHGFIWRKDRIYSRKKKNIALSIIFGLFYGLYFLAHGEVLYIYFLKNYTINTMVIYSVLLLFTNHFFAYFFDYIMTKKYMIVSAGELMQNKNLWIR